MSNEPIKPIEQNYVPFNELFPSVVQGGIEVKDDLIDSNNTYSSEKIEDRLGEVTSSLTQAIEDIDLSPYATTQALTDGLGTKQSTSEKNIANGYMGLDSNAQFSLTRQAMGKEIIDYKSLMNISERKTTFTSADLFLASATSGNVYALNRDVYFDSNFNTSSTKFDRPCLYVSPSATNSGARMVYNTGVIFPNNALKILVDISIVPNIMSPTNDHAYYIGLATLATATLTTFTGSGLLFKYRPSENSGNIQIIKVLSNNITTLLNTNIAFPNYSLTRFRVLYDKALDTAYLYINNTLVHTESSVLLVTTSAYYSFQYLFQSTSGDANAKWYGTFDHMIGVQNLP